MNRNERDLSLKLRIMRFLWYNGFFVRKNIELSRYEYGEVTYDRYTDIDVMAIRTDENFKQTKIICDCKSGKGARNVDRIFWLSGLMKIMGGNKGIFFRTQINESKYFELARKLEVTPLSSERLEELEKNYEILDKSFIGSFNEDLSMKEVQILKNLKDEDKILHNYITSRYWNDPPHRQIKSLINSLKILQRLGKLDEEEKIFLQVYILSLISNSILKFSEPILIFPDEFKENHIKESLLGEGIEIRERKQILNSVYDFMSKEITQKGAGFFPISKKDFINQIYPNYSKYLIDLILRMCLNPIEALQVPRLLDIIAYEIILKNDRDNLNEKLFSYSNNFDLTKTIKLTKNFFVFCQRAELISNDHYKILNQLINECNNDPNTHRDNEL